MDSLVGIAEPLFSPSVFQPISPSAHHQMANPEMRSPHQPPNNPPPDNHPPPNSPPKAGTAALMWAWVLFTALLAGLVAWGWVQYLRSPKPSTYKISPAPVEPALPASPQQDLPPPYVPKESPSAPNDTAL